MILMNHIERRKKIMEILEKEGSVTINTLKEKYDVGSATIRRDLKFLSETNNISLSYGGAYLRKRNISPSVTESTLLNRQTLNLSAKRLIAEKAAGLVSDGDTIGLNSGSTVELILDFIKQDMRVLNIITICLNVAMKASSKSFMEVYLPGGKVRGVSKALVGSSVCEDLSNYYVDTGFFGASAVDLDKGVMHPTTEEIDTNKMLMRICNKSYLVCDSSKFDTSSLVKMFNLKDFDGIIVDNDVPAKYIDFAKAHGIEVI